MNNQSEIKTLATALVKAQEEIKHAAKDAMNHHNSYATLESVIDATKGPLQKNGITVIQYPTGKTLVTRLQHASGEFIETTIELYLDKQTMQGLGSAITYARRYALAAMLNISQADDDGEGAGKKGKPQSRPAPAKAPEKQKAGPVDPDKINF